MATSAELLNLGLQHHQGGNLAQAEVLYRQVLQVDPGQADALHLLGVLAHQTGNHQAAITLVRQAIAQNPLASEFHFHLGIFHKELGQWAEAAECFRNAMRGNPNHGGARNNLGIVLFNQGKLAEAEAAFREAVRYTPNNADAYNNLGKIIKDQGKSAEAVSCFRQALQLNPNLVDALSNLGSTLMDLGQQDEALACYRRALGLNPNYADAHYNLGNALAKQGKKEEAVESFRQALRIKPNNANAHNNLGNAFKELGRKAEAEDSYRQAVRLNPHHASASNNLGLILSERGQLAEAADCFRQSLRADPNSADVHSNLGSVLVEQGFFAEGEECFREAMRLNPKNANAQSNLGAALTPQKKLAEVADCFQQALHNDSGHNIARWNRSLLRLLQGDFAGGWADYESRWVQPGKMERPFLQPRWDGSPLDGKTILLHAEQGLGDTLLFVRYARLVKERGGRVLVECQPPLLRVLEGVAGIDQLLPLGKPLPAFDVQVPLMSLAGVFGTTLTTIPNEVPYVRTEPELVKHWRGELAGVAVGSPLNVGIVWQGNPTQGDDRYRSVPLAQFSPLAKVPGVRLVSLQVGHGSEQLQQAPFPIIDLGSRFDPKSLHDLAAVLPNLDLVVTVCTSVAHLAGTMGLPAWVALKYVPFWCWLLDRDDSIWYPTLRLFRQPKFGHWSEVFERIAGELSLLKFSPASRKRAKG